MGSTLVEVMSLVLGIVSFLFFIACSTTDCWRQDAKDPYSSVGLSSRCRGLWSECVYDHMANIWTCDIPISYLSEHPVPLVATRALVIVNAILTFAATPPLVLGMKCIKFISGEGDLKRKLSRAAGLMLLLGGVCGGVALFWYAVDTVLKYRMEVVLTVPGITYELGYSYWFATGSTGCACVAAFLLLSMNCRRDITAETKSASAIRQRAHNNAMTYL
ncbi:PREDICTED: claudin-16-like [Nanorana parkeri]|uniref:claudin-16-like n=1 Tax=Nanorana parkeri TaxID=125878 RepID=UPI0008549A89|nr:PREDICTED: claudin-16-like [Nanorana parkeri]